MTEATSPAPRKLFREQAKTGSLQCLACGGPITLHGFGAIERVMCPYCGSELKPEPGGALELVAAANRARQQSRLELHERCTFEDKPWEILGIVWRECVVDGVRYPWEEFLLFNPYEGYRFLIYSRSDGHWSLAHPLDYLPREKHGLGHPRLEARGQRFRHFQTVQASVTYVEGEFPWQVHVGDVAQAREYIAPPHSISVEQEHADGGGDVNFTKARWLAPKDVWKAFSRAGSPPPTTGIAPSQPNPWLQGRKTTWLSLAALLVLWGIASGFYRIQLDPRTVYSQELAIPEAIATPRTETVEIGDDAPTTLEFRVAAPRLFNEWASAEVLLVAQDQDSERAYAFGAVVDEWHGVSGGESWKEGDTAKSVVLGGVPPGRYLLQITTAAGGPNGNSQAVPDAAIRFELREDAVLLRYILLPLVVIIGLPILFGMMRLAYEGRRWKNSDYSSS